MDNKNLKQFLNTLFSQEEVQGFEKSTFLLLLSKSISKINAILGDGDAEVFNQLLADNKAEEALRLLEDKQIDLKKIILESKKELAESLGDRIGSALETIKQE